MQARLSLSSLLVLGQLLLVPADARALPFTFINEPTWVGPDPNVDTGDIVSQWTLTATDTGFGITGSASLTNTLGFGVSTGFTLWATRQFVGDPGEYFVEAGADGTVAGFLDIPAVSGADVGVYLSAYIYADTITGFEILEYFHAPPATVAFDIGDSRAGVVGEFPATLSMFFQVTYVVDAGETVTINVPCCSISAAAVAPAAVPEPSTLLLFATGTALLLSLRRRNLQRRTNST